MNAVFYKARKCPQDYVRTNGISFFAMDPNHPTSFAFFSIGQYAITGDSQNNTWQDTFKFLNKEADDIRKANIYSEIQPGLELYRFDNKKYPESLTVLVSKYLAILPTDPVTKQNYAYQVSADKLSYIITAIMDDGSTLIVKSPK